MKVSKSIIGAVALGIATVTVVPACGSSRDAQSKSKKTCKKGDAKVQKYPKLKKNCPTCGMG